eukprot:CAMPEP_0173214960 /NCGR_PEP_ID=MMETSP1141-20130122/26230_1 /TAXON_ID=483371 /ORGANISM="non described non described, Strain CCMP2298" /LENGTH=253 /DNA_ID=CAMNT_0014142317 /DNA_START=581 /DNA_END=1345 /DNA_ORIENTATION=+
MTAVIAGRVLRPTGCARGRPRTYRPDTRPLPPPLFALKMLWYDSSPPPSSSSELAHMSTSSESALTVVLALMDAGNGGAGGSGAGCLPLLWLAVERGVGSGGRVAGVGGGDGGVGATFAGGGAGFGAIQPLLVLRIHGGRDLCTPALPLSPYALRPLQPIDVCKSCDACDAGRPSDLCRLCPWPWEPWHLSLSLGKTSAYTFRFNALVSSGLCEMLDRLLKLLNDITLPPSPPPPPVLSPPVPALETPLDAIE